MTDPREVRFLASQAERLAGNISKQQQQQQQQLRYQNNNDDIHPHAEAAGGMTTLLDHENNENYILKPNVDGVGMTTTTTTTTTMTTSCSSGSSKDVRYQFFSNFRKLCAEFRTQLNSLLFVVPGKTSLDEFEFGTSSSSSTMTTTATDSNDDVDDGTTPLSPTSSSSSSPIMGGDDIATVKEYYATSSKRRHVGRTKLDAILQNVRILQNHALSSSTTTTTKPSPTTTCLAPCSIEQDNKNCNELLLSSMIQCLQMETITITPTDIRLLTNEIHDIITQIDYIRDNIICPKDKFVFSKYRKAMSSKGMMMDNTTKDVVMEESTNTTVITAAVAAVVAASTTSHSNKYNNHDDDGGILENISNCTIVISVNNTIHVIDPNAQAIVASLIKKEKEEESSTIDDKKEGNTVDVATATNKEVVVSSSSYLLQNMTHVTILLHGIRPTIQLRNLQYCNIYISNVTCGAVHVTQCHTSVIYSSSYQLRIHDSTGLQFAIWVRSGPIIENCNNILFAGNYYDYTFNSTTTTTTTFEGGEVVATTATANRGGNDVMLGRNMFYDVKDFNWLRTLHKSPNFNLVSTLPSSMSATTIRTVKEGTTRTDIVSVDNDKESGIMKTNGSVVLDGTDSDDEL